MRFFKILIFAAIVTALFVGAYWLIVRPSGTGGGGVGPGRPQADVYRAY